MTVLVQLFFVMMFALMTLVMCFEWPTRRQ
jgi:hypothetical protein